MYVCMTANKRVETEATKTLIRVMVFSHQSKTTTRQMLNLCIPMMPFIPQKLGCEYHFQPSMLLTSRVIGQSMLKLAAIKLCLYVEG